MPVASPLTTIMGKKCRLYFDARAAGTADYALPIWTEVGFFEEGEVDTGIETTELGARIHRGMASEAVSGFKPVVKGKLTRVKTLTTDPWVKFRDRCTDTTKLGDQVLIAEVDGDITTAGTTGLMMWAIVKSFNEKHGKDVLQADLEFAPGIGDTNFKTYEPLLVV